MGARVRRTAATEKPPIFGMVERAGKVAIRMLDNVRKRPIINKTIAKGSLVFTQMSMLSIMALKQWVIRISMCHSEGE